MTDRGLAVGAWVLGIATILIVTFAIAAMAASANALGTTLPRDGWVPALVGWGVGGGAVLLVVARATGDEWPARSSVGLAILLSAITAGVAVELTVMTWAAARFGAQAAEPDLIGWSSLLSPSVVLAGLGALAGTVLRGPARTAAHLITVLACGAVLLVVASNLPGAADGITPLGLAMGLAMVAAALVVLAALATIVVLGKGARVRTSGSSVS